MRNNKSRRSWSRTLKTIGQSWPTWKRISTFPLSSKCNLAWKQGFKTTRPYRKLLRLTKLWENKPCSSLKLSTPLQFTCQIGTSVRTKAHLLIASRTTLTLRGTTRSSHTLNNSRTSLFSLYKARRTKNA